MGVPGTVLRMASSVAVPAVVDLRKQSVDPVLERVEQSLQVRLDRDTVVRKRRTVGARSDRGTWVRLERRGVERIDGQGWNGAEAADYALYGVVKPAWLGGVVWRESEAVVWRADEMELLPAEPIGRAVLGHDPGLPEAWWEGLNTSLDALAAASTPRIATPDTVTITQAGVTEAIRSVFPGANTTITRWAPAHADLTWANMTAPQFCLFDWEDWGLAPAGLDAASLWSNSLAVPALAGRVLQERRKDLESRDGKLMILFACTKILGPYADPDDPRKEAARDMAERIVKEL